jgi:hypothetical protein
MGFVIDYGGSLATGMFMTIFTVLSSSSRIIKKKNPEITL